MESLTPKQQVFFTAFLSSNNATQAAIAAGYSEKTAYSQGQRLLKNVEIQELLKQRVESLNITVDEVLKGVHAIATDTTAKNSDRLKGYELLGKHLRMWGEKDAHKDEGPSLDEIASSVATRLQERGWSVEKARAFTMERYQQISDGIH